jgi:4-oxalomesaconate tautomerase
VGSEYAQGVGELSAAGTALSLDIEHPTGFFTVAMEVVLAAGTIQVRRSALLRTTRKPFRGEVYVPAVCWNGA